MRNLFVAVLCCLATSVFAQGQGGFGGPQGGRGQFDPAQMVTRQADRLKKTCELTDEQYEKVKALYQKQADEMKKQMEEAQQGQGQGQRMDREAMQKQREAQEAELKKILTEDQWKKYEEEQKTRRQRRGQGGPGGQGGPQGGSQDEQQQ